MMDKGAITQAIDEFQDAINNYITVIANKQQRPASEIKADPVVAGWIHALDKLIAFKDGVSPEISHALELYEKDDHIEQWMFYYAAKHLREGVE